MERTTVPTSIGSGTSEKTRLLLDADTVADALAHVTRAAAEVISLPVHPSLDEEDLDRIATAVNALAKAGA